MHAQQVIETRRSIRSYTEQPVPVELVEALLDTAIYAPNHKLREPWRFVLAIEDGQTRYVDALTELLTARGQFETKTSEQRQQAEQKLREVPVYLTVLCQVQGTPDQQLEDTLATAAMIQNLQLVATERGLGCCWKSGKHWFTPEYASLVDASENERVLGVIQIGWPAIVPPVKPRTSAKDKLTHF
ncbi:nitroreductase [Exiguobacterium indicum]|uniref:Putative NAD(P)H nitroreductase n=1 Tax=Exiguobacterium indicum TaxID=296995 RepID=A0AAW3MCT6_9BACL|nr:nitroreductase [Exiguobacterium indicum]KTR27391.1 nitroreductase [Exiguobacterium indicum]